VVAECGASFQLAGKRFNLQSCATEQRMDLEQFREYCLGKRGAREDTPFGADVLVFKVAGKMFALAQLDQVPTTANLKCDPDLALDLRDRYEQVSPGYHMNKKHWNTVEIDGGIPESEVCKMIDHSYELVVQSLSKAKQAALGRARRPVAPTHFSPRRTRRSRPAS
jgi:predicted DNA-binding protein (MmcQ/YjbR family)